MLRIWGNREEEEEQGPRGFYRGERRGSNTPGVGAAGMGYTGGSCCGDKVGDMVRFPRERMGNK